MSAYQGYIIRKGKSAVSNQQESDLAYQIITKDGRFQAAAFKERVSDAFLQIQKAWCSQSLEQVRPFISDGIFERFSIQFQEQRLMGQERLSRRILKNPILRRAIRSVKAVM